MQLCRYARTGSRSSVTVRRTTIGYQASERRIKAGMANAACA